MTKEENDYPEEQHSLIIMDTFKGKGNDTLKELCSKNNCEIVIVPHNLTNKSQPLDISVNKAANAFIQNQYNDWFLNEVSIQLKKGIDPADIKIISKLSYLKPLHVSWIVDLYKHLSDNQEIIVNCRDSAGISEAVTKASARLKTPSERCRSDCIVYFSRLFLPFVSYINHFTYPFKAKVN